MAKQQVFSEQEVNFGIAGQKLFWNWAGDNSTVPPDSILDVTTATFSYFPTNNGSVGRADLCGRNSGNNAVWRLDRLCRTKEDGPPHVSEGPYAQSRRTRRNQFHE